jgi:integrase
MKRRSNHEGSEPKLRKDGRWQAMYTGADCRRHSVAALTVSECRSRLRAAIRQSDDGWMPTDGRLTVGGWLDIWIRDHVRGGTKPRRARTAVGYEAICRLHLKPTSVGSRWRD